MFRSIRRKVSNFGYKLNFSRISHMPYSFQVHREQLMNETITRANHCSFSLLKGSEQTASRLRTMLCSTISNDLFKLKFLSLLGTASQLEHSAIYCFVPLIQRLLYKENQEQRYTINLCTFNCLDASQKHLPKTFY